VVLRVLWPAVRQFCSPPNRTRESGTNKYLCALETSHLPDYKYLAVSHESG
jgi:hypothetical protein